MQIFVPRLKNRDFILEIKMAELSKNTNSKNQIDQMQCETLFYLGSKLIAQLRKFFTHVLQNHCS